MANVLISKYNSTGERCINACLNYGELRYLNEDGSPTSIEVPFDKYEEAISDFEDRKKEGLVQSKLETSKIFKTGNITYNQARTVALEGRIKAFKFYEIDGSIECEHVLGISGSIEYALSIWNGESREEALLKASIRAIKIHGDKFIKALNFLEENDEKDCLKFAQNICNIHSIQDMGLYKIRDYSIDSEVYIETINDKKGLLDSYNNLNIPIRLAGILVGFALAYVSTLYVENSIDTNTRTLIILIISVIGGYFTPTIVRLGVNTYTKESTYTIMEMFNEELLKVTYENLLTEKEAKIILKNITRGELTKLLLNMKGSVNKKISSNAIVSKETRFIMDARSLVVLPSEQEIKESLLLLVENYNHELEDEHNSNTI